MWAGLLKSAPCKLTDKMIVERYSHVMHIVSNVTGQLQQGDNAFDVLAATFPAGTVSGAPKIRAMEIIDELEPVKRGIYAGAVGYIAWSGQPRHRHRDQNRRDQKQHVTYTSRCRYRLRFRTQKRMG